jgi:hypothetical protein
MTFTFTKAHAQMVSRLLELNYEGYKEFIARKLSSGNELNTSNSIEAYRHVHCVSEHERRCEYEGEIDDDDDECACKREFNILYIITTKINGALGRYRQTLFEIIVKEDTPLHELTSKVNAYAGKVYHTCSCGEFTLDGKSQCRDCYIFSYERPDAEGGSCAVCYENHGMWAMVKHCKHAFHKHCLEKCEKKCPLCRHEFEHYCSLNGVIINPYL